MEHALLRAAFLYFVELDSFNVADRLVLVIHLYPQPTPVKTAHLLWLWGIKIDKRENGFHSFLISLKIAGTVFQ